MNITPQDYGLPVEYQHHYSGKVRDIYLTPQGNYLFVASDRISAFDCVLTPEIPEKGKILTQISLWWFEHLGVKNHLVSEVIPESVKDRAMVGRPLNMFEVECVVRGYLAGSGWKEYQQTEHVCGVALPPGLKEFSKLPNTIFTPATKEALGQHDENIDFTRMEAIVGKDSAQNLRDVSLALFQQASEMLQPKGLTLADTKFEFGEHDGEIYLADEVLTPDSSRFWVSEHPTLDSPAGFDKQFVRNWILSTGWTSESSNPPPELPEEIVSKTRDLYIRAFERITGEVWR